MECIWLLILKVVNSLRRYIRLILEEDEVVEDKELLTEPDETDGDEEQEVSAGGVAGVAVPLGAGPHHPLPTRRRPGTRSPEEVAASAYGGSSIKKSQK